MISRILEHFLSKYFDDIFFGISRKNIHAKLLEGKLVIQNIGLQPEFFSKLNLPIELRASFVEKMSVEFSWMQHTSLVIEIESIYAVVVDKHNTDAKIRQNVRKAKQKLVKDTIKQFASRLKEAKEAASNKQQSTMDKYLIKLLDNIQVRIKYIHLRYQNRSDKFAFGLIVHDVQLETRDQDNNKVFFNRDNTYQTFVRQVLQIRKLGIYWNSSETMILSEMNHSLITSHMLERAVSSQIIQDSASHKLLRIKYILTLTVSVTLKKLITPSESNPQFQGAIDFEEISCKMSQLQYSQVMKVVKYFLSYQARMKEYFQANQLQNFRPKSGKDILVMMKQSYKTSEAQKYMRKCIREYLTWTFKHALERNIKNRFIQLVCAIPKKVTVEAIFKIPRLVRIIHKTDNQKLKDWISMALLSRTESEEQSPFLLKKNHDLLETTRRAFAKLGNMERTQKINQEYIWLRFSGKIQKATFQIAEPSGLGLCFSFKGVEVVISLRHFNFFAEMEVKDVNLVLFNDPSPNRAQISILRKNTVNNYGPSTTLLKVNFQKNPISKPYVFAEMYFEFRSIQISIFPSTIKEVYRLFTTGIEIQKHPEKKYNIASKIKEDSDEGAIRSSGFQRNIINARIYSPWIIMPLSRINDLSSECWVVRLGDLEINTPEEPDSKQNLYYEGYNIMLENFELKYFSSLSFFYNWIKFKDSQKLSRLLTSDLIDGGKSIQVIRPFSCSIDLKQLKRLLSAHSSTTSFNYKIVAEIQQIDINYSSFVTSKLKKSIQDFKRGESEKPIQLERNVILRCGVLQQTVIVNYRQFQNFKFYLVYMSGYLYLYLTENSSTHSLLVPITDVRIVLRSMQTDKSVTFNQELEEELEVFFESHGELLRWKVQLGKQLDHLSQSKLPATSLKSNLKEDHNPSGVRSISQATQIKELSRYSIICRMPKLSVRFIDEKQTEFLNAVLGEIELQIQQKYTKEVHFSVSKFHIDGPTFKELPLLITSEPSSLNMNFPVSQDNKARFMRITIHYDEFNSSIREINLKFRRLTMAWKIDLIQKILQFLNIDISSDPTLPTAATKKKQISIQSTMEMCSIVCIHNNYIFAETRIIDTNIGYQSARGKQNYVFKGKVQFYGFDMNDQSKPYPVFTPRNDGNLIPKFQLNYTSASIPSTTEEVRRSTMKLLKQESFPILKITVEGYQLVYIHEFFNRLFNYILNKIMGSITSKFKIKKEYPAEYIYQVLKIKKPSVFDISLNHFKVVFPGDNVQTTQKLAMYIRRITISRNLDPTFPLEPKQFPSLLGSITVNYEKMIITCHDAELFYIDQANMEKTSVIEGAFGFQVQYNKYNLSREYYPVLRTIKDLDLTASVVLAFEFPIEIQLRKSILLQIMRTYYRNIKQKDGLALEYQAASLHPTPRVYVVSLPAFRISFMEEVNSKFSRFFMVTLPFLKANLKQLRTDLSGVISTECLQAQYYDTEWSSFIRPIDTSNCPVRIQMKGSSGDIVVQIKLTGSNVSLDMNQLNNIINFVDFDPSDVDNQKMPKKLRKSFQNIKVFVRDSTIGLQAQGKQLQLRGVFLIDYSKNPEGFLDDQIRSVFGQGVSHSEINEKDIKVNLQNLEVTFDGIKMSQLPNMVYRRHQITNRVKAKKLRREYIFFQQFLFCVNTGILPDLQSLYKTRLKKDNKSKKSFYDASTIVTPKLAYDQRRKYSVSTDQVNVILLGQSLNKSIKPIIKVSLQIGELVAILVNSVPTEISILGNLGVWNKGYRLNFLELVNASNISANYTIAQDSAKRVTLSGNTIKINGYNINEQVINKLISLKNTVKVPRISKTALLKFRNDTSVRIRVSIRQKQQDTIVDCNLSAFDTVETEVGQLQFCRLYEGNMQIVLLINQDTFVVGLVELQMNKLLNIGNLLYMLVKYNEDEAIEVRFQTKFRLQNTTGLQFKYSLLCGKQSKTAGILLEKKNVNFDFEAGDKLYLREQSSKEEVALDLKRTVKKLSRFNVSLQLQNKAVYVCRIHPKVVLINLMPNKIRFTNSKCDFQVNKFQETQLPFEQFFSKNQIMMVMGGQNYRCQTSFFKQGEAVLELVSPSNRSLKTNIKFSASDNNNSMQWRLQSPAILLNASYRSLTLKKNYQLPHLSTVTLGQDESLMLGSQTIIPSKLSSGQELSISSALSIEMIHSHKHHTPIMVLHPSILFVNQSSCEVILNSKFRIGGNQALPIEDNPDVTPLSLSTPSNMTPKSLDFSRQSQYHFFLNSDKGRHLLKIYYSVLGSRRIVILQDDHEYYSLKNGLQGWTLVVRQRGQKQEFVVREGTDGVFTMQDPAGQEVFEVEFYLNCKSKEFKEKYTFDVSNHEPRDQFFLDPQSGNYGFNVDFKQTSKKIALTVTSRDQSKILPNEDLQVHLKRLAIWFEFRPEGEPQARLTINFSKLFFQMRKSQPTVHYRVSMEELDMHFKETTILKKNRTGNFLDLVCSINKSKGIMQVQQVAAKCNGITINLKEDVVTEILTILNNINLMTDKKAAFDQQRAILIEELLKGNIGLNELKKLSFKFYNKTGPVTPSKNIIVRKLQIQPISAVLSYAKRSSPNFSQFNNHSIVKYLLVLPDIRQLKVHLPQLVIENYEGDSKTLKKKIYSHIKKSIPNHIISSISSLSVFQSPVDALDMIGYVVDALYSFK